MKRLYLLAGAVALSAMPARAQTTQPATQDAVSRQEYDRLQAEHDAMRRELDELKQAVRQQPPAAPAQGPAAQAPAAGAAAAQPANDYATQDDIEDLQRQIKKASEQASFAMPGSSVFTIHGDMDVSFNVVQGEKSTFEAGFAPLILIRPTEGILVEAGADIGLSTEDDATSSTSFDLTIANVSFLVNDNLAVGAGLFVVPFGQFHNHFDPPWINKLPDEPLPFGDAGIAPSSQLGAFARGAFDVGTASAVTYDVYVTNGPNLVVSDPDAAGSLNFDDFTDLNDNKAVGGRLGFRPARNWEVGYSIQFAQTSPDGFSKNVNALLQALDLNYRKDYASLGGWVDFRTEWVVSDVDRATYDPDGSLGFGPATFSNHRQGGYVQLAYRPTRSDIKPLAKTEFVTRYDWLYTPTSAPGGDHEKRLAFGVDYWITPAVVAKVAYEIDERKVADNQNALLLQLGVGF